MAVQYSEYGNSSGPVLVFLHGGGVGGWMWDQQVDYFRAFHCVVPTLQGHGDRSEESHFSITENALEIIEWLQSKINKREVHIVGFSIGAQIALEMIRLAPTLFHSVMVNSALVIPMKMAKRWIAPTIKWTAPLIKNRAFSKLQAKQLYIGDAYFERYYQLSIRMKSSTLIDVLKENMAYQLPEMSIETTARILITVGEKEKGIMRKSASQIANYYSTSTLVVLPKVGHGFSFAQPELFNQLVEEWVTNQPLTTI